jgi:hypothetical protein
MDDATRTSTTIALCHICTIKNPLSLPSVMQVVKNLLSLIEIQHKGAREPCKMSYGCKLSNANLSMEGEEHIQSSMSMWIIGRCIKSC